MDINRYQTDFTTPPNKTMLRSMELLQFHLMLSLY